MARSAADLGLELEVLAGPDELAEGIGYTLSSNFGSAGRRLPMSRRREHPIRREPCRAGS
jgi:hypothetical protein